MLYRPLLAPFAVVLALAAACGEPTPCEHAQDVGFTELPLDCPLAVVTGRYPIAVEAGVTYQLSLASTQTVAVDLAIRSGETTLLHRPLALAGSSTIAWTALATEKVTVAVEMRRGPMIEVAMTEIARADDHAARLEEATPIDVGAVGAGEMERAGDADLFRFAARAGVIYRLEVIGPATPALLTASGEWLLPPDHFPVRLWRALSDEPLFVAVTSDGAQTGGYTLRIDEVADDDYGNSVRTATPLAAGQLLGGIMSREDQDWFAIDVPPGQLASVRVVSQSELRVVMDSESFYAASFDSSASGPLHYQRDLTLSSGDGTRFWIGVYLPGSAVAWQPYTIEYLGTR